MTAAANDLVIGPLVPALDVSVISLDFLFENDADIRVVKSGVGALTLGVDYLLTGAGSETFGAVTLTTPANGVDQYAVYLVPTLGRSTDLKLRGQFKSEPFNLEMDRLWRAVQSLSTRINRGILLSESSLPVQPLVAEKAIDRALKFFAFDAAGLSFELTDDVARVSDIQDIVASAGNVPGPILSQIGYILRATGVGTFAWETRAALLGVVLEAVAAVAPAANKGLYFTGASTAALFDLSAFARTLLDDADGPAMRATMGAASDWTETSPLDLSGTSQDWPLLPAGLNEVEMFLEAVQNSGTDHLEVRLGHAGGFLSAGYDGNSFSVNGAAVTTIAMGTGFSLHHGVAADAMSGVVRLRRGAGERWFMRAEVKRGASKTTVSAGDILLPGPLTQIRLRPSGANTFAGAGMAYLAYRT